MQSEFLKNTGQRSPSGEMFATFLVANGGEAAARHGTSILSAEAFHASPFPLLENLQVNLTPDSFGQNLIESFAFFDLAGWSWKMSQACFLSGLDEFLETWPRAGMMLNGFAFRLPRLVRRISENGFSLWDGGQGMLPSMVASLAEKKGKDLKRRERGSGHRGPDLQTYCIQNQLPTLTANMNERCRDQRSPNRNGNFKDQLPNQIGGLLNPTWCEWYQGFPEGWTKLEDSATP